MIDELALNLSDDQSKLKMVELNDLIGFYQDRLDDITNFLESEMIVKYGLICT